MKEYIRQHKELDKVSRFRLINRLLVTFTIGLMTPIVTILTGQYLPVYLVSIYSILNQLSVKTNKYMTTKYSIQQLYKIGVIVHFIFTLIGFVYFYNKFLMVNLDAIVMILEIIVFGALSIKLDEYQAKFETDLVAKYKIIANTYSSDFMLLGLGLSTLLGLVNKDYIVITFVITNIGINVWLINNLKFYERNLKGE